MANRPQFAILTATRPLELAYPALTRAVQHRATGGHEARYLALDAEMDVINADEATPESQHGAAVQPGRGDG